MNRGRRVLLALAKAPALPAALLLLGTLLVFVPSTLFHGNQPFFTFALVQYLAYAVPGTLLLAAVLAAPGRLLGPRWGGIYTQLLYGVAFAMWINATFTAGISGLLDGTSFRLERNPYVLARNFALFVVVATLVFFAAKRFAALTRTFVLVLVALLSLRAGYIAATARSIDHDAVEVTRLDAFSKSSNLLLVLMDAFEADIFAEILERIPGTAKPFTGFTFYPDTASVAPSTSVVLPTLHSGQVWDGTIPLPTFYDTTVGQGSFMSSLVASGFDGSLVNPHFGVCPKNVACQRLSDVVAGEAVSATQSMAMLVDLGLLRAVPHVLEPAVYRNGQWLFSGLAARERVDVVTSNAVLTLLAAKLTTDSDKPTVKFLHLMSTHPPVQVDAACDTIPHQRWSRAVAVGQAQCALDQFVTLLDRMKREGIYDPTAIILFADHGSWNPRDGGAALASRANPLLLIKPAGATGSMRTSTAQASLADFPATACALVRKCQWPVGQDVATLGAGNRDRTFVDFKWKREYWEQGIFPIYGRYRLNGPVLNLNSWNITRTADAKPVYRLSFTSKDDPKGFGPGWRNPGTKAPRWTTGAQAVVWVSPRPGGTGRVLAAVSTHAQNVAQQMTITVAGKTVYRGTVTPGDPQEIAFALTPEALREKWIALRLAFSQWTPERERDTPLAVAFHRLEVQ